MIRCLENELWEMRHNKLFWITNFVGVAIICVDILQNYFLYTRYLNLWQGQSLHIGYDGINLFNRWICVNLDTVGYAWFFLLFPVLAALPFSWSYCRDNNSGFLRQIAIRIEKKDYFFAKTVVVFLAGAFSIGIPLLFDLLGTAMILPANNPDVTSMQTPVWSGYYLSEMFYSNPWLYSMFAILTDMLWGGVISVMALAVGCIKTNTLVVLSVPFIIILGEDYIANTFILSTSSEADMPLYSPLALLHPVTVNPNPSWLIFGIMGIHLICAIAIIFYKGVQREIF